MKSAEEPEGAQIGLLHHIFGVRVVARQPARQVIGGVEVGQDCCLKTGEFVLPFQSSSCLPYIINCKTDSRPLLFPTFFNLLIREYWSWKTSNKNVKGFEVSNQM